MGSLVIEYHTPWMILHICCTTFYIYVMIKLHRNRAKAGLAGSFFTLWFNLGIADVLTAIISWACFKLEYGKGSLPYIGALYAPLWTPEGRIFRLAVINYVGNTETIGLTILAMNRFTSVFYPVSNEAIWTADTRMRTARIVQFGSPILFFVLALAGYIILRDEEEEYRILTTRAILGLASTVIVIVCTSIVVVVNIAIVIRLGVQRNGAAADAANASISAKQLRSAELKLTVNTMFLCSMMVWMMAEIVVRFFGFEWAANAMWFFGGDVYAWCNPFMLCLTSKTVRKIVLSCGSTSMAVQPVTITRNGKTA